MRHAREVVTPEMASKFLHTLMPGQRRIRKNVVKRYAQDMKHGRWLLTPNPIAIGEHGHLIDGQHRLSAVVEAAVPVEMFVCYGVPMQAFGALDIGLNRSAVDLSGNNTTNATVAMVRAALTLCSPLAPSAVSPRFVLDTTERNIEVIEPIMSATPSSVTIGGNHVRMFVAPVRAVLLRAVPYYGLDAVLMFARGIVSDTADGTTRTARDFLISSKAGTHNDAMRVSAFRKFARLLKAYAEGEPELRRVHAQSDTPYPLRVSNGMTPDFRPEQVSL
jgi:hypothetical protein